MKAIVLTVLNQTYVRKDWFYDFDSPTFNAIMQKMIDELLPLGIKLEIRRNHNLNITVNSYADLLNCIKISSPQDNHNHCAGHIIGKSENLDIIEDISRAVRKIAFAPETVAPDAEFRKVCHNCGCGC